MPFAISSTASGSTISPRAASPPILSLPKGAWLAVQVIAHNLARWTARIGLGEQLVTTKILRRRFCSLALALGKPVQSRPRSIAPPAISGLTAATSPLTRYPAN